MDPVILDDIPFTPTFERAAKEAHIKKGSKQSKNLKSLLQEAREIGHPKATYRVCLIDEKGEEQVTIQGIPFHSRVLRANIDSLHRVFPYIATCGMELEEWKASLDDMLINYYASVINKLALRTARQFLKTHIEETYKVGETSYMSPGSLPDWPITEQRNLFQLLGDPQASIGVTLQPSLMMTPSQTVSGIRFSSQESFQSCQLCPMEACPHRKAPYDPDLYEEEFA